MTVSSDTARVSYSGDGATVVFAVSFYFLANSDLRVIHRSAAGVETAWTLDTQYNVSGAGDASGGSITVKTSPTDYTPASGETLVILRDVDITQETDYVENDEFAAETHERALDKLTMINQQQTEEIDRAIRFSATSSASGVEFPDPIANAIIKWNSAADDLEAALIGSISATFDAVLTSPTTGDMLAYDGSQWVNQTAAATLVSLGAEPADSDILKADTSDRIVANMGFTPVSDSSSSGAVTFDFSTGNICKITLTENITSITLSGAAAGDTLKMWITAAGSYTVSGWPAAVKWAGNTAPTMSSTAGAVDIITLEYDGTNYYGAYTQDHR